MEQQEKNQWWVFQGDGKVKTEAFKKLENTSPPWRRFESYEDDTGMWSDRKLARDQRRGQSFFLDPNDAADTKIIDMVNAALYLRRPLLVTGDTGIGKSSLAYSVAYELNLGSVLEWPITSHSTVRDGEYEYDPIERMREVTRDFPEKNAEKAKKDLDIGVYFRLRQLGTAFVNRDSKPRVVLIDELDKSDMDLPNNLLGILEDGEFLIPELARLGNDRPYDVFITGSNDRVPISGGVVRCRTFPFIIITSNGEREFPKPFLRRCIRLELQKPSEDKLKKIVERHFKSSINMQHEDIQKLIGKFFEYREKLPLATDQLLNAIHLYLKQDEKMHSDQRNVEEIIRDMYKPL
ncbi:MAG: AAA family ATPase [Anaerolineales bacterium]